MTTVPRPLRVIVPTDSAERPRAPVLIGLALGCFVVGILVVRATLDDDRESAAAGNGPVAEEVERVAGQEPDPAPVPAPEPASNPDSDPVPDPVPDSDSDSDPDSDSDADAVLDPDPVPDTDSDTVPVPIPTTAPTREHAVRPGRIAYLRCDGARRVRGPYPCPRDLDLEAAAWQVIDTLPTCASGPDSPGETDVRIAFQPGAPTEVSVRAPQNGRVLPEQSVLSCLAPPLRALETRIRADLLIVSFRFAIVER